MLFSCLLHSPHSPSWFDWAYDSSWFTLYSVKFSWNHMEASSIFSCKCHVKWWLWWWFKEEGSKVLVREYLSPPGGLQNTLKLIQYALCNVCCSLQTFASQGVLQVGCCRNICSIACSGPLNSSFLQVQANAQMLALGDKLALQMPQVQKRMTTTAKCWWHWNILDFYQTYAKAHAKICAVE